MSVDDLARESVEDLWSAHAGEVWAYAARRIGKQEAEDVVERTFEVLVRRNPSLTLKNPRAWLLGVARRVIADSLRSSVRSYALHERLSAQPAPAPGVIPDTVDQALVAAFQDLTGSDQELLLLIAWDGLAVQEAGEVLGLRPAASRMRLQRARRRLRSALGAQNTGVPVVRSGGVQS